MKRIIYFQSNTNEISSIFGYTLYTATCTVWERKVSMNKVYA